MIGIIDGKFNNSQTQMDEFYKGTMYPMLVNIQEKLKQHLFTGYPSLCIEFDTSDFLKGAPLDQMNYIVAGVTNGILTPNEAREYLGRSNLAGGDELKDSSKPGEQIPGTSPQDTGGGGNTSSVGKTGQAGKA
jgi:phage portal protein BeeE